MSNDKVKTADLNGPAAGIIIKHQDCNISKLTALYFYPPESQQAGNRECDAALRHAWKKGLENWTDRGLHGRGKKTFGRE